MAVALVQIEMEILFHIKQQSNELPVGLAADQMFGFIWILEFQSKFIDSFPLHISSLLVWSTSRLPGSKPVQVLQDLQPQLSHKFPLPTTR